MSGVIAGGEDAERWVVRAGAAAAAPFSIAVTPQTAGWMYSGLKVLTLAAGQAAEFETGPDEALLVPLSGGATVSAGGQGYLLAGRPSVFAGISDSLYLPRRTAVEVHSAAGGRFALATARAVTDGAVTYLPAEHNASNPRGGGGCSRQVVDLCNPELCPADRLLVVEVYTPAGNVSSTPPHKHDRELAGPDGRPVETELEEIYYFELSGAGAARHRTFASDERSIDVDVAVSTGDVALVPYGWHGPCWAPPGADLYYLNVMAGPVREWRVSFHPTAGPRPQPDEAIDPRLPLVGPIDPNRPTDPNDPSAPDPVTAPGGPS